MEKIEIVYNKPEEAIAVMKEVARWGREQGYRVSVRPRQESFFLIQRTTLPSGLVTGYMHTKAG